MPYLNALEGDLQLSGERLSLKRTRAHTRVKVDRGVWERHISDLNAVVLAISGRNDPVWGDEAVLTMTFRDGEAWTLTIRDQWQRVNVGRVYLELAGYGLVPHPSFPPPEIHGLNGTLRITTANVVIEPLSVPTPGLNQLPGIAIPLSDLVDLQLVRNADRLCSVTLFIIDTTILRTMAEVGVDMVSRPLSARAMLFRLDQWPNLLAAHKTVRRSARLPLYPVPDLGGSAFGEVLIQLAGRYAAGVLESPKLDAHQSEGDWLTQLQRLSALHREGALTDEEFRVQKQRLLPDA